MTRWSLVVGAMLASAAFAGWSKQGEASTSFSGAGPAGFKIEGAITAVTVEDDGKAMTITSDLSTIETGIGVRNKHLKEDAEAEKFPKITLKIPADQFVAPADGKESEGDGKGTFGLHGQTKEITFHYKAKTKGNVTDVDASADVNVNDFGIKIRSYMGITVKPDIKIAAKISLTK
jgi:polyisoprenoid-binding protein YceI